MRFVPEVACRRSVTNGVLFMDERYESLGVRPKAVVFRFYSDGSYEEFWELAGGTLRMNRFVADIQSSGLPRVIINIIRLPPGPIPPLPEPWT
jgi:hypothetical protein